MQPDNGTHPEPASHKNKNKNIVIISGRSGSGKSTALHVLEDVGYYCVDNLPVRLMSGLIKELAERKSAPVRKIAIGIDARNSLEQLEAFPTSIEALRAQDTDIKIMYLDADDNTLLQRFSETRRKHPVSTRSLSLSEAIERESVLLKPVAFLADINIDTSRMTLHSLRDLVKKQVGTDDDYMTVVILSFGFKHGIPSDADFIFDVRCLTNPHWVPGLRVQTGLDEGVQTFLSADKDVNRMFDDIRVFLEHWLPQFSASNRSYMTIAIGCTGGQHRSVYMVERLKDHFETNNFHILARHRDL
ncbi:Uncharacterized P-loop ATPase protein UPF0042 [gamma proteobacterium HdN1]|nr:Uncharacterized P-loop ATPase protein UPF0042 [gamma proteobacterium HdN1]